jgi:ketosteroid isomerase-like protein
MTEQVPIETAELVRRVYAAFNARRIDELVGVMSPDVDWPDMIEHVRVHGPHEVRAYWARQFESIDPKVEPVGVTVDPDGRVGVDVHQVVRAHDGALLADQRVRHVYTLRDGLITRMDVEAAGPDS